MKTNPLFWLLLSCFSVPYYLASQFERVAAQPHNGDVTVPTCAMQLNAAAFVNESLLLVWGFLSGESCGTPPAEGYNASAIHCNATLFGNVTKGIRLPEETTSICPTGIYQLLISANNQTLTSTPAFQSLVDCFKNLTFIQEQCAARRDEHNATVIGGAVIVGVLCYLFCVGTAIYSKTNSETKPSASSKSNKTDSSYLLEDVESQKPRY